MPIVEFVDFDVVGDLHTGLPAVTEQLGKREPPFPSAVIAEKRQRIVARREADRCATSWPGAQHTLDRVI